MNHQSWAAIFDWDGVVVDSSRQHELSWKLLAEEEELPLAPGFFPRSFGMKNEKIIPELLSWSHDAKTIHRLGLRKEVLYREILQREHQTALPGVLNLLNALQKAKVPCAVASSAPRANIDLMIDDLGFRPYFQSIVTGEDVTHGKPNPEVFLLAARRLGMAPERSVVFEDAHVGIEAGKAAGMKVVAVATTHPAETLGGADRVVHRLTELNIHDVEQWFVSQACLNRPASDKFSGENDRQTN
jgi:beta-phosphoglucomutase family hydrolase